MNQLMFGVNVSTSAASGVDPVAAALRAEALGFDFVSSSDHPCGSSPSNEVWTQLCFVAAGTTRIRFATRVLGVPYRPPPMVAKMAETLDRLSGGRLILGLGGGSADDEHRAFGLGVRTPREKVDGLEDALAIIHGLWSQPKFSYEGRLYHTDAADIEPKPQRKIPIWLGTYGPRAVALTGRVADGWIPSLRYASPEEIVGMRGRLVAAAENAGRDPAEITCAYNVEVRVGERVDDDRVVSGSVDDVVTRLTSFVELGFSALHFVPSDPGSDEQVERLAAEVVPALRR